MSIQKYRCEIDEIDRELLDLLNKRAQLARKIGREKQKCGIPVLNTRREQDILDQVLSRNPGPLADKDIRHIYEQIIYACRGVQIDDA